MRETIIAFILGTLLAAAGVFVHMMKQEQKVLSIFKEGESARAAQRAKQAYQHEEPAIAIWELRHLVDVQTDKFRKEQVHTNEARAVLLITRARLAKLYHEQGREAEAQSNAQIAIKLLEAFSRTNNTVMNLPTLLEHLGRTDSRATKEPKYE